MYGNPEFPLLTACEILVSAPSKAHEWLMATSISSFRKEPALRLRTSQHVLYRRWLRPFPPRARCSGVRSVPSIRPNRSRARHRGAGAHQGSARVRLHTSSGAGEAVPEQCERGGAEGSKATKAFRWAPRFRPSPARPFRAERVRAGRFATARLFLTAPGRRGNLTGHGKAVSDAELRKGMTASITPVVPHAPSRHVRWPS